MEEKENKFNFKKSDENPILVPDPDVFWESEAVFNGCPIVDKGKIHFLYRAQDPTGLSTIGYASSKDGIHFKNRHQFIRPEYEWEQFGCEDPRVVKIGQKFYIFYTALSAKPFTAEGIKVGLAITKDFKKTEKHLVTNFNSKAMTLFPSKINGKFVAMLSVNTDRPPERPTKCIAFFDKEEDIWSQEYWDEWYASLDQHYIHLSRSHLDHTEVGAPPIKTKHGWLVFYSYAYNYYSPIPVAFTTEVALLDLKNPKKVIARSEKPLLFVRDSYERFGKVPNINFPSGAFVKGQKIYLYYGAADTVCAVAMGNLEDLIEDLDHSRIHLLGLERFEGNPILQPNMANTWEQQAVFNAAVLYDKKKIHLVYRAMSNDNTSVMGYASTTDGFNIEERLGYPIYTPREDFEGKGVPGGNSGCEDPRLTKIGDTVYMTYTAFNGKDSPRVALTSILYKDFVNKNWNWKKPVLISPPGMDDKDAAIFPQKINGKYAILHRLGQSVWIDYVDSLDFKEGQYIKGKILMDPRSGPRDSRKIGIAGPPIKTKHGWLLIYHGVSKKSDSHYHLRAALLDLKNPEKVLVRTKYAIFETETSYEKYGVVPNVVFSDGAIVKDGKLFVYYGAADKVIGVATMELDDLLRRLSEEGKRG